MAPSKGDDSVISTTRDIKVRDETVPFNLNSPVTPVDAPKHSTKTDPKDDPRNEMKRRGEEKKKLLAALRPTNSASKVQPPQQVEEPSLPLFVMDAPSVVRNETPRVHKTEGVDKLRKSKGPSTKNTKQVKNDIVKSSASVSPNYTSKHTELRRQKMRERERTKRAKESDRKQSQQQAVSYHTQSQRKTTLPIEGPVDSLREMGSMLAAKLAREKEVYMQSYNRM